MVCPDCGAPYHRVCYEKLGQCIHRPAHAAGYEWKFPYEESQLRTCPSCGERTLRDEETCRCCGAVLPPRGRSLLLPAAAVKRLSTTPRCTVSSALPLTRRRSF